MFEKLFSLFCLRFTSLVFLSSKRPPYKLTNMFSLLSLKLKKCIKTPEIPSKHVRNWVPKVLEQRRQGLETYLQVRVV
jgi:hypothetical protein